MNRPLSQISIDNRRRFKKAPTIEQIDEVLKRLETKAIHYERLCGIPEGTIYSARTKLRRFPVKYWHFIYTPDEAQSAFAKRLTKLSSETAPINRTITKSSALKELK